MSMWEPFTEEARVCVVRAQEEAQRLGNDFIGIEHLLLGVLAQPTTLAARHLHKRGIDLEKARGALATKVEAKLTPRPEMMGFTPEAKSVIEGAFEEARRANLHYINLEMLLLGILGRCDARRGSAVDILLNDREAIASDLRGELRSAPPPSEPAAPAASGVTVGASMWEPFTENARRAVVLAQEEAQRLEHNYIGTEHLLLGIISEGESLAATTLETHGVNLARVRAEVEAIVGRGGQTVQQEMVFTPRAKRVIELAFEEARQLKYNYIGIEHLLLGLLRETEGVAARVLAKLGVDRGKIAQRVRDGLSAG